MIDRMAASTSSWRICQRPIRSSKSRRYNRCLVDTRNEQMTMISMAAITRTMMTMQRLTRATMMAMTTTSCVRMTPISCDCVWHIRTIRSIDSATEITSNNGVVSMDSISFK